MKTAQFDRHQQQMLRFDTDARIEIFVDATDIETDDGFAAIMESATSDEEKIQQLKVIALKAANEALDNVEGVTITANLSVSNINLDSIDWMGIFERYNENKATEADYMAMHPEASNDMKIKLSQKQWESIGKKAGWMGKTKQTKQTKQAQNIFNTKMMPGQTPYTTEELKDLDALVRDAAEGDRGEAFDPSSPSSDDNVSRRRHVKVTFNDGNTVTTSVNGTVEDIRKYYLPFGDHGEATDFDNEQPDKIHWPVKVEFLG